MLRYRYAALRLWHKSLKSADSELWVQLTPGTAVGASPARAVLVNTLLISASIVIDNHRVLHGRSAFEGKRRMCGAYIGMDDYRSKLAVLTEKFAGQAAGAPAETSEGTNVVPITVNVWSPLI